MTTHIVSAQAITKARWAELTANRGRNLTDDHIKSRTSTEATPDLNGSSIVDQYVNGKV